MSGALQAVFQNQRSFAPPNIITTQKGAGTTNAYGVKQFSIDSTGNSYAVLSHQGTGLTTGGGVVSKITPTGSTAWYASSITASYNCGCGENPPYLDCGIADSSGNLYLATQIIGSNTGGWNIAKFNSSGTIQWQRKLQYPGTVSYPLQVGVDSSGNVYVLGYMSSLVLVKYNSSGVRQWQKVINYWIVNVAGMYVDPSGNIYLCGSDSGPPGLVNGMVAMKLDTSGTVVSFSPIYRASNGATTQVLGSSIAVDSTGSIYISGAQLLSGVYSTLVLKLNSSFALQWGRYATGGGVSTPQGASQLSFDSSDNVYVAAGNLTKYNSSGTTQLQRNFTEYSLVKDLKGVQNYQTNMYVASNTGGANGYGGVAYVLPNDGSKTGTYTVGTSTLTYAASSQTITTYVSNTSTGRADVQNLSTVTAVDSPGTGTINTITTTNVTATI